MKGLMKGMTIQQLSHYRIYRIIFDNCWTFMEITRKLISFAVSVHPKVRLRTKSVVTSCSCCRPS